MPKYNFSQLSAFDFEMLVHGLPEKEWGCRLEAFKSGRDRGIDLRYSCSWLGSQTIIQCKHYVASGFVKLLSHLKKEEAPKVSALAPDRYFLVTSVGLTPDKQG
jgi:Restriction endonuclease